MITPLSARDILRQAVRAIVGGVPSLQSSNPVFWTGCEWTESPRLLRKDSNNSMKAPKLRVSINGIIVAANIKLSVYQPKFQHLMVCVLVNAQSMSVHEVTSQPVE